MSPATTMDALVDDYLVARRSVGFDLRVDERQLRAFARFADHVGHHGPITWHWPSAGPRVRGSGGG